MRVSVFLLHRLAGGFEPCAAGDVETLAGFGDEFFGRFLESARQARERHLGLFAEFTGRARNEFARGLFDLLAGVGDEFLAEFAASQLRGGLLHQPASLLSRGDLELFLGGFARGFELDAALIAGLRDGVDGGARALLPRLGHSLLLFLEGALHGGAGRVGERLLGGGELFVEPAHRLFGALLDTFGRALEDLVGHPLEVFGGVLEFRLADAFFLQFGRGGLDGAPVFLHLIAEAGFDALLGGVQASHGLFGGLGEIFRAVFRLASRRFRLFLQPALDLLAVLLAGGLRGDFDVVEAGFNALFDGAQAGHGLVGGLGKILQAVLHLAFWMFPPVP